MPQYDYLCPNKKCGKTVTACRKVEDRDKPFKCVCGEEPKRTFSRTSPPIIKGGTPKHYR